MKINCTPYALLQSFALLSATITVQTIPSNLTQNQQRTQPMRWCNKTAILKPDLCIWKQSKRGNHSSIKFLLPWLRPFAFRRRNVLTNCYWEFMCLAVWNDLTLLCIKVYVVHLSPIKNFYSRCFTMETLFCILMR